MALGTPIELYDGEEDGQVRVETQVVSAASPWSTVIDAGGMDDQDAATITAPATEIVLSTRHIFRSNGRKGTFITARMAYDDGVSGVTSPVVKLFGRYRDKDFTSDWQILENKAGSITSTVTVDTTNDVSDGTLNFTHPDADNHVWDCVGCNEFLFGVETAFAATGTVTTAYLEARMY